MDPDTAKPATADTVNGPQNSEQLAGSLSFSVSKSPAKQQGRPLSVLQHAVKRDGQGRAASLVGEALDQIAKLS